MSSRLKALCIGLLAGIIVIAGVLFGVYKYFVTPQRIVLLSLMDVKEEIENSFSYMDEGGIKEIRDYFEEGGKIESELEMSDSVFNDGVNISFSANSDENCTVSDVKFNDKFEFEIYKDSSQIYINTPLFSGGFSIPVNSFYQEWNRSVFKDMAALPDTYGLSGVIYDFISGNYDAEDFAKSCGKDIAALAGEIKVEKTGTAAVMEGSRKKRAGEYTAELTKEQAEQFMELLTEYINKSGYGSKKLEDIAAASGITKDEALANLESELKSAASDMDIIFKIDGMQLRELVVNIGTNSYTAAFEGEKNQFDMISLYINGDTQNAWRRVKSSGNGTFTDKITKGGTTYFTFENNTDGFDIRLDYDGINIYIDAHSMKELGNVTEFDGFEIGLEGIVTLTGCLKVYDEYDEDFSFSKSGDYVDILSIGSEEWQIVSETFVKGLELLSGKE